MSVPPSGPYGPPPGDPGWGPPPGDPNGGGQPQYGQPQYGQPQYGQPQYGQPQYGQPQYGQPQYGQPQYGPQYGPPGYGPPPGPNRTPVVVAVVLVVLLAGALTLFLVLRGGDDQQATRPTGASTGSRALPSGASSGASSDASTGQESRAGGASSAASASSLAPGVVTLYRGLTDAYAQSARTKNPSAVGAYIAAHNNASLGYTASECNATSADLSDPITFAPEVSTLARDEAFTKVVNGRYAGRPVTGPAYSLSLTTRTSKGQTATNRVHVAIGDGGGLTFFFECE